MGSTELRSIVLSSLSIWRNLFRQRQLEVMNGTSSQLNNGSHLFMIIRHLYGMLIWWRFGRKIELCVMVWSSVATVSAANAAWPHCIIQSMLPYHPPILIFFSSNLKSSKSGKKLYYHYSFVSYSTALLPDDIFSFHSAYAQRHPSFHGSIPEPALLWRNIGL